MKSRIGSTLFGLIAIAISSAVASAPPSDQHDAARSTAPPPPPGLAGRIERLTQLVLEHHVDPPARQQMILSGVKALYKAAGTAVPAGLSSRVSAVTTREEVDSVLADAWPKSTAKAVSARELEESLMRALLSSVPAQLISEKERKVTEQFEGNRYVGIHVGLRNDEVGQRPVVAEVFPGGPADKAGVKNNDVLEEIDGAPTKGVKFLENIERLRGAEGTTVTIKVRQPDAKQSRTYSIVRGQHPRESLRGVRKRSGGGWTFRLDGPDPIGYVQFTDILGSTPHELRKAAQQLESEGLKALVLDLRTLDGRSAHTTVLVADSLLESGTIGRIRTNKGETRYQADPEAILRGWPLAVLVDGHTMGPAEWLAAALQDNKRAIVVGSPTQSARFNPGSALLSSAIPVDGEWAVSLDTGVLERGNGRPLSLFDQYHPTAIRASERSQFGVHPNVAIPDATSVTGDGRLTYPIATGERRNEIKPGPDAVLVKAVEALRESLKKP